MLVFSEIEIENIGDTSRNRVHKIENIGVWYILDCLDVGTVRVE